MRDQRHFRWKRAAAMTGLLGLLCFWTASAAHVHGAAPQGSVRQECQLCAASNASYTLTARSPIVTIALAILFWATITGSQVSLVHFRLPSSPRSPPRR